MSPLRAQDNSTHVSSPRLTQAQFREKRPSIPLHRFYDEIFLAVTRLRCIGMQRAEGLAEAFYVRKIVF